MGEGSSGPTGTERCISAWTPGAVLTPGRAPACPILSPFSPPALVWDSAKCPPSPPLPFPCGTAHMRMIMQSSRTRVLTAASPAATRTSCATGRDCPVGTRSEDRLRPCTQPRVLQSQRGSGQWSCRPSCITGCGTAWTWASPHPVHLPSSGRTRQARKRWTSSGAPGWCSH